MQIKNITQANSLLHHQKHSLQTSAQILIYQVSGPYTLIDCIWHWYKLLCVQYNSSDILYEM